MSVDPERALDDLGKRLQTVQQARQQQEDDHTASSTITASGAGIGFRIALDLVAGIGVGVALGLWLDHQLGTKPWLLLLLTIIGFCAGLLNVVRTATQIEAKRKQEEAAARKTASLNRRQSPD